MKLGLLHRGEYPEAVRLELEQIVAAITTAFYREHDAEGDHVRITGRWKLGANVSVATSAWTHLPMVLPDVTNAGITATTQGYITVPVEGQYLLLGNVRYASGGAAAGVRAARVLHRGIQLAIGTSDATALNSWVTVQECIVCAAGDTVELQAFQSSGGALNVEASETFLRVTRVGG